MNAPAPPARSSLYECTVLHERTAPRRHRFRYRVFYLAVDLDELPALHRRLRLFSFGRANLFSLRESDYLPLNEPVHHGPPVRPAPAAGASLKERAAAFCAAHGIDLGPAPRVVLVTLPRVLGYLFNPVSFYFCHDAAGTPRAAIAEVTNTFREMKPFLLAPAAGTPGVFRARHPKHFYVSPFSPLDLAFDFTLHAPGGRLAVRIDDFDGDRRVLHSTLTGRRAPLDDARLAGFLLKYPLLTLRVIALIHWEALRLWLKRVPFFRKAARPADQRDLYRPHSSLSQRSPA